MTAEDIEMKVEAARTSVGAALVTIWGITLNEWAAIVAIIYTGLQVIILMPKFCKQVAEYYRWIKSHVLKE